MPASCLIGAIAIAGHFLDHLVGSDLLLVSSYVNWLASEGRIWMSRSIAKMSALQVGSREADAFN